MTLTRNDLQDLAYGLVKKEIKAAEAKHGLLPPDPNRRLRILVEEVGEIAKALEPRSPVKFNGVLVAFDEKDEYKDSVRQELAQVAATAIRWLADLEPVPEAYDVRR